MSIMMRALTVATTTCGREPAADFASEDSCERYIVWNAGTQSFDYAPVSTVKMIQWYGAGPRDRRPCGRTPCARIVRPVLCRAARP